MSPRRTNNHVADGYADELLDCRYPNHGWKRSGLHYQMIDRRKYVAIEFKCACGAVRTDILGLNGERVSSRIRYGEGYLVRGQGRIDKSVWRREVIRRSVVQPE